MKPISVAVVGVGYWGPNLIRNIALYPATTLSWVCDLSQQKAAAAADAWGNVRIATSIDEVLADDSVDAVAVATPAGTHFDLAIRSLEAGKHVLVEKPLATTLGHGRAMVEAAESKGLVLMADHTFCYTGAVRKIRELIQTGQLGEVRYFDSVRINLGLVQNDVDVFWDLAPHDLSILDFVLPEDSRVTAVGAQGADPLGVGHACIGYLSLRLSGGGMAHVHLNWLSPAKIRTVIIGGSKKMLVWDDLRPTQRVSIYDSGVDLDRQLDETARRRVLVSYRTGAIVAPALEETEALTGVIEEFVAAIREHRQPITDGRAGLRVLGVLAAIDQSLAASGALIPVRS